jgi:hypothetical protein
MGKKVTIVVGAGSTLSDATNKPLQKRPPLDRGFFKSCGNLGFLEKTSISGYLKRYYDIDPTAPEHDSLEHIMAIVYADINNPTLERNAVTAFRTIIQLFNRRIAETTNELSPTNRTNLYRILSKQLRDGIAPKDISIVTFNQDLQIEKVLRRMNATKFYSNMGQIFCFPNCYRIDGAHKRLTAPPDNIERFDICEANDSGISLFKLHGSLNWFSTHTSKRVPKNAILNPRKDFKITPRFQIPVTMQFRTKKKMVHTFPLIIPPVNHKAAILHKDLHPVWSLAEQRLRESDSIIVFGYSCPATDFESANLLRRTANTGTNPTSFNVIDPNPKVFQRYIEVTNLDHLSYFRSADAYIQKG